MTFENPLDRSARIQAGAFSRHAGLTMMVSEELAEVELGHGRGHASLSSTSGAIQWPKQVNTLAEHGRELANGTRLVWNLSCTYDTRSQVWTYGHALCLQAPMATGQACFDLSRTETDAPDAETPEPWTLKVTLFAGVSLDTNRAHLIANIPADMAADEPEARASLLAKLAGLKTPPKPSVLLRDDEARLCLAAVVAVARHPLAAT